MNDDEAIWKQRFLMFSLVRISGVAIIALGLAIAFTDLVRDGGWRGLGALIIVLGTIDAAFAPMLLKRSWRE